MSEDKNKQPEQEAVDEVGTGDTVSADEQNDSSKPAKGNADSSGELSLEAQLEAAQLEIAKLKDSFLRAKAEEDNVRRRSEKEIANSRKFAVEGFAKEMVNVHDSLKLACNVDLPEEVDESVKSIQEGVEVTLKQLDAAFKRFSLTEINPDIGVKLDPNIHQAMSIIESEEVDSGCIINVVQAGFQLHDRLLRPAMVIVAK
ncbi:MAG: nucleotide exchange factor GrpE [Acidiferrobacterales bacterium]|nr:nucleotide exchange factor GrpE [Acidiferrobacterales bacterium]